MKQISDILPTGVIRTALVVSTLLFSLIPGKSYSQAGLDNDKIKISYNFSYPQLSKVMVENQEYEWVSLPDGTNGGHAGEPSLPSTGARILLPAGMKLSGIEIQADDSILVGDNLYIAPNCPPMPLSDINNIADYRIEPNVEIYSGATAFPSSMFENIGVQKCRGYSILVLKLTPFQYKPSEKILYFFPKLNFTVRLEVSDRPNTMFRGLTQDQENIYSMVDNPDLIKTYGLSDGTHRDNFDLLILTVDDFALAFEPLKTYHNNEGIITEIRTLEEIGYTHPIQIRDYIRDVYLNEGIDYVLIGGDDDIIRAMDMYVEYVEGGGSYIEYAMPVDNYYGCLDGTYDYDGDGLYGEPTDGEEGGDVDLIAEVYVGRASGGTADEITNFVNKTIGYLSSDGPYLKDALMVGQNLGFPGLLAWGGNMADGLIDSSTVGGYYTTGVPSTIYNIDKLYDRDWPDNDWPATELINRINEGRQFIYHVGHANEVVGFGLTNSQVSTLANDEYFFGYSIGCLCGRFDGMDCWSEYATVKNEHGAFALITNARIGASGSWIDNYSIDGPSHKFMRQFVDAVFSPDENKPQIGRANHDSKEDNLHLINEDAMRWCTYDLILFGDPTVAIKRLPGITFEYPDGTPSTAAPGETTTLRVNVNGTYGGVPVSGSGQLYYKVSGGELQTESMTEISPNQYETILPALSCDEYLEFYISADEITEGTTCNPDPSTPNHLFPVLAIDTLLADNFEADKGWTGSGLWERGIPTGAGSYGYPDPTEGCNGPNLYGYNLSGDYEDDMIETYLISPVMNCRYLSNVYLDFKRWLCVDDPVYQDHASIKVSTNGTDWTAVWENIYRVTDEDWSDIFLDISELAAGQSTVNVAFVMGATGSGFNYCGWNIDDLHIYGYRCREICGDANGDKSIDILDIVHLINYKYKEGAEPVSLTAADVNSDTRVDILDIVYLINYKYKSGPDPDCS